MLALRHVQHARVSKVRHTALVVGASAHDHSSYGIGRIGRRVATHRTMQWVVFFVSTRQPAAAFTTRARAGRQTQGWQPLRFQWFSFVSVGNEAEQWVPEICAKRTTYSRPRPA